MEAKPRISTAFLFLQYYKDYCPLSLTSCLYPHTQYKGKAWLGSTAAYIVKVLLQLYIVKLIDQSRLCGVTL